LIVGYVALLIVSEVVRRLTNRLRLRERVLSAITPSPSPVAGSSGRSSFELT